jgi:hypothetical protein
MAGRVGSHTSGYHRNGGQEGRECSRGRRWRRGEGGKGEGERERQGEGRGGQGRGEGEGGREGKREGEGRGEGKGGEWGGEGEGRGGEGRGREGEGEEEGGGAGGSQGKGGRGNQGCKQAGGSMQMACPSVLKERQDTKAAMGRGPTKQRRRNPLRGALRSTTFVHSAGHQRIDVSSHVVRDALLFCMKVAGAGGVGGGAEAAAHGGELQSAHSIAQARCCGRAARPGVLQRWGWWEGQWRGRAVGAAQDGARVPAGRERVCVDLGDAQGQYSGDNGDASE